MKPSSVKFCACNKKGIMALVANSEVPLCVRLCICQEYWEKNIQTNDLIVGLTLHVNFANIKATGHVFFYGGEY